ncbi:hypothetical protein imdm_624 [gamma proteobacterium IMCC2047]|nr:hypothetical protein imdm_624 [gamma proteobacterium IMCC2047]
MLAFLDTSFFQLLVVLKNQLNSAVAQRQHADTWSTHDAFLATAEQHVDTHFFHGARHATNRRNTVDANQRRVVQFVQQSADFLRISGYAGACFVLWSHNHFDGVLSVSSQNFATFIVWQVFTDFAFQTNNFTTQVLNTVTHGSRERTNFHCYDGWFVRVCFFWSAQRASSSFSCRRTGTSEEQSATAFLHVNQFAVLSTNSCEEVSNARTTHTASLVRRELSNQFRTKRWARSYVDDLVVRRPNVIFTVQEVVLKIANLVCFNQTAKPGKWRD